ncbi:histidine phosphatase family protein [Staphylococcus chromogenes]|nr:histidine phosphatase family protein [Staphylococcus chromogenes]
MTGRLILLRHGQTYSNLNRILDTRPPGAELTDLGRSQASAAGAELVEMCGVHPLPALVSSVAIRAQQTAVLVADAFAKAGASLPIEVLPGIHEISAGELEGAQGEEAATQYTETFRGWLVGDTDARIIDGENVSDVLNRYRPVLENLVASHTSQGRDVIVVSHGAAIRTVSCHATGVDPDFAFGAYLPNCRFVVLSPSDAPFGEWELVRWADTDRQI